MIDRLREHPDREIIQTLTMIAADVESSRVASEIAHLIKDKIAMVWCGRGAALALALT